MRAAVRAARQAAPAGGSCWGGLRFAPTPLRCSLSGRAANSLRSLRSLRSNRRGESDCGSALRAPTRELRSSPPQKSPPPGAACRATTDWFSAKRTRGETGRACQVRLRSSPEVLGVAGKRLVCNARHEGGGAAGGYPRGRFLGRRGAQPWSRRAQRVSYIKLRRVCLSAVSAANEASSRRDSEASTAAGSERSADRSSMSPRRVPPAAPTRTTARTANVQTAAPGRKRALVRWPPVPRGAGCAVEGRT